MMNLVAHTYEVDEVHLTGWLANGVTHGKLAADPFKRILIVSSFPVKLPMLCCVPDSAPLDAATFYTAWHHSQKGKRVAGRPHTDDMKEE